MAISARQALVNPSALCSTPDPTTSSGSMPHGATTPTPVLNPNPFKPFTAPFNPAPPDLVTPSSSAKALTTDPSSRLTEGRPEICLPSPLSPVKRSSSPAPRMYPAPGLLMAMPIASTGPMTPYGTAMKAPTTPSVKPAAATS